MAFSEEGSSLATQEESKKRTESTGDKDHEDFSYGNFAHFVSTDEGNCAHASILSQRSHPDWILDSGASKHVAGTSMEFESYIPYPPTCKETIQTADGTSQPIKGIGTIQCTPLLNFHLFCMFLPFQSILCQ